MNLVAAAPSWMYAVLLALLASAAVEDVIRLRISNLTCGAIALLAIAAMLVAGPAWPLWQNLFLFTLLLVVGTAAFSAGFVGGGDVKLLAAVGLWIPIGAAPSLLLATFSAGGVLALIALLSWRLHKSGGARAASRQIPYGVAIAIGAAIAFYGTRTA